MSCGDLERGRDFGRYLDVDGDGIPWRTIPGAHPTRGAYFTRGTSRDSYARYTEEGGPYVDNMERLLRKFDTARSLLPRPQLVRAAKPTRVGVIHYGSTAAAMDEARDILADRGRACRRLARARLSVLVRRSRTSSPRTKQVFVVEQNRDAQLRTLLMTDLGVDAGATRPDPALRRNADHRALHPPGNRRRERARPTPQRLLETVS